MAKVTEWVDRKRTRLEKQYRMSEDGFNRAVWKEKCGNKGPLLHVIESDQGKRCAGYSHAIIHAKQETQPAKSFTIIISVQYVKLNANNSAWFHKNTL